MLKSLFDWSQWNTKYNVFTVEENTLRWALFTLKKTEKKTSYSLYSVVEIMTINQ